MFIRRDRPNHIIKVSQLGYIVYLIDAINVDTPFRHKAPVLDVHIPVVFEQNPLLNA